MIREFKKIHCEYSPRDVDTSTVTLLTLNTTFQCVIIKLKSLNVKFCKDVELFNRGIFKIISFFDTIFKFQTSISF
jgi:hypothetical protein